MNRQALKTEETYHTCRADVGFGNKDNYQLRWNSLKFLPRLSGHGIDSYGQFICVCEVDTTIEGNILRVTYKRVYKHSNLVVYFDEIYPFPLTDELMPVESNWRLEQGRDGWESSGEFNYHISRNPTGVPQNAYIPTPVPASGMLVFDSSSKLDFYIYNFVNCPFMSGRGISQMGTFTIENASAESITLVYDSCQCHLTISLQSSEFVSVYSVTMTCVNNDGTLGEYTDETGSMIIKPGLAVNKAKLTSQNQPTWLEAQFTERSELDGTQIVTRATSSNFVLFPKISGDGTDDEGDFSLVAFTTTSLQKVPNCFWKVYNSGKVIQYDTMFTKKAPGAFTAQGTYQTDTGRTGSVVISAIMGVIETTINDVIEPMTLILNSGSSIDHFNVGSFIPEMTGSGADSYSEYIIKDASFSVNKNGHAKMTYTKVYNDGTEMGLTGKVDYPISDTQEYQWEYTIDGNKAEDVQNVFGLDFRSGTMFMLISKPTENDYVKPNEVTTFNGKDMTYTVSIYPFLRGSGEDEGGQFKIIPEGQSSVAGDELIIRGRKQYISGPLKGQKFFFSSKLPYPPMSMSGVWTSRNAISGATKTEFLSLHKETKASLWSKEAESFMSIYLGCDKYLTLHSSDMIKLPTVSGSGSSDFGDYTVTGDFDVVTGGGIYKLTYSWGECSLSIQPQTSNGIEMVGVVSMECTGDIPVGYCEFSTTGSVIETAVTESIGADADDNKIIVGEHKAVFVLKRNDGKTSTANGVLSLFPSFDGHGKDDYKGNYRIVSKGPTSLTSQNIAIIEYDAGITLELTYNLDLGEDASFTMTGTFFEQPTNQKGTFTMNGEFHGMEPMEGWCPVFGSDQPEPWLTSWPRRDSCAYPDASCAATIKIVDAWCKPNKHNWSKRIGYKKGVPHYGFAFLISVPKEYWVQKGWTVALRFPPGQKNAEFTVSNAQFLKLYQNLSELNILLTSRVKLDIDKQDKYSFVVYVDYLSSPDKPSILFWPKREKRDMCFKSMIMGRSGGLDEDLLDRAIQRSRRLNDINEVKTIKMKNNKIKKVFS